MNKSQQLQLDKDTGNITKLRSSTQARCTKPSKFLAKTSADYFQVRKPLNIYIIEELENLGRKTYFQRVYVLAKNIDEQKLKQYWNTSNLTFSDLKELDFRKYFQRQVEEIFASCEKKKCTPDNFSGLFVAMGTTYSVLMIEGPEDMLADFFHNFSLIHDQIWSSSRIFLVDDKIGETYFDSFYSHCSAAININEKLPPSIADDFKLMAEQHLKLKHKMKSLVATLSHQLKEGKLEGASKDSSIDPFDLPADPFNKLLPEIQRIDLVLNASRFYRSVNDFSHSYRVLQTHQDEDAFLWPIQNNYTPLNIFRRSEFDVNLTFGHYEEKKQSQENVSHRNS